MRILLHRLFALTMAAALTSALPMAAEEAPAADRPRSEWTEQLFFEQFDEVWRAGQWNEAREMILEARSIQPPIAWLARRDAELRLLQARIAHELGRTTEMLAAARLYLNGDNKRSGAMLELAREVYRVDQARAIELAKEIRRRSPDYPPVRRLLAEWQSRAAKR